MLILPLHRPLTRATFPIVTALLVVLNVAIFVLFQAGDWSRLEALEAWYGESGLAQAEWPAYLDFEAARGGPLAREALAEVPDADRAGVLFHARLRDLALERALAQAARDGTGAREAGHAGALQRDFDARASRVVTLEYRLRYGEIAPLRWVTAAFLHGGAMRLLGNMFFLLALGLLVEGALGPWRFILLYLAGAVGASLFALAWRWGEAGAALGASGAIAALMGAFALIWGWRPVRFFWWFFVLFDYVKKPAIWLLPVWVGWEALNLVFNPEAGVGFDAHLGGLFSGALLGWAFVRTGQVRHEFLDETDVAPDVATELDAIRARAGRMDLAAAQEALDALDARVPGRLDVSLVGYRLAVLGARRPEAARRALQALDIPARNTAEVALQLALLEEAFPLDRPVPGGAWREGVRRRWLALGCLGECRRLLEAWLADSATAGDWFELALRARERGEGDLHHALLEEIVARFPAFPEAGKARFMLEHGH